ncbi:MAG: hypothetical protein K0R51_2847 [Cytophagaceae bacterium]|jgi:hypothetical protein|nr:hypothetical protein [Cytophagaceae bacterium]
MDFTGSTLTRAVPLEIMVFSVELGGLVRVEL